MPTAYFDYQSSTPVLPEVREAMRPYWQEVFATPSSLHQQGLKARDALGQARAQVQALIRAAQAEEIIFTSGGTESANLAVKGVAWAQRRRGNHIVVSAIEHPSVLGAVAFLERQGFVSTRVGVDPEGRVDPEAVREALREDTILVCVHHANHDIGTIEPVTEIGALAAERGIPFFVDAVASGGWLPIDVQAMGATLLSLSPHRFHGPKGVGVLYRNRRIRMEPLLHGGRQEEDRRAGTENVPAIVGAGLAAQLADGAISERMQRVSQLQRALWDGIQREVPYVRLNGPPPGIHRLPTQLNVSIEFVEGEGLALMCDVQGIAVASGASCLSRSLRVSPVLEALGLDRSLAQASILLSLGAGSSLAEADYFVRTVPRIVEKLRSMSPMWEEFRQGRLDSLIRPRG